MAARFMNALRAPCVAAVDVPKAYGRAPPESRDGAGIKPGSMPYTFGNFRFEPATARLWQNGTEIKLTRKAAQVLAALLEQPGEPVSKDQLFASVWQGTVVSDDALVSCVQ